MKFNNEMWEQLSEEQQEEINDLMLEKITEDDDPKIIDNMLYFRERAVKITNIKKIVSCNAFDNTYNIVMKGEEKDFKNVHLLDVNSIINQFNKVNTYVQLRGGDLFFYYNGWGIKIDKIKTITCDYTTVYLSNTDDNDYFALVYFENGREAERAVEEVEHYL